MNHTVTIYKGEEHVTRKEFKTFKEAMAYLEECEKLSEDYGVHYVRKASKRREVRIIGAGVGVGRSLLMQTH